MVQLQFNVSCFHIYLAPSTPPVNVMATLVNSSGFTLMWGAPPAEDQNGVIRHYAPKLVSSKTNHAILKHYSRTSISVEVLRKLCVEVHVNFGGSRTCLSV